MDGVDDLGRRIPEVVGAHPAVHGVRLVGSRAEGRATEHSDWDFLVETEQGGRVAADLVELCAPLEPLSQQWDRLSPHYCWMLMLRGPVKVDLVIGDDPHELAPPWVPAAETLGGIDDHFWDWVLWLNGKQAGGKSELVTSELVKLFGHILAPLGVEHEPSSIAEAVDAYRSARAAAEARFACAVSRRLEHEVAPALVRRTVSRRRGLCETRSIPPPNDPEEPA